MGILNTFITLPLPVRLVLIFAVSTVVGTQLNRGIYRLAWFARAVGPWSQPAPGAPPRRWYVRLPIVGWFFLRHESSIHGRGYWVRPMLIELAMGCGACLMYWYEVEQAAVFAGFAPATLTLHAQFFSHYVLICLTVVATFIDFDEQTIPDAITVPGAVIGLAIAALLPNSRPFVTVVAGAGFGVEHLHLASATAAPNEPSWPPWLDGGTGLCLGILAFFGWWVAVLPYTWTTRRGFAKAVQYFFASVRKRLGMLMPVLAFGGAVGIVATWFFGGAHWESLLSSLTGLTFGGGLIWAVRIVGKNALKQEAMGFGDVTLMAMIGTYTGWQATLMIFFLAPFAAIFISVTQWLLTGRKDIAFGPYLCLAALVVILRWGWLWDNYGAIFALGLYVVFMVVFGVALIWAMLTVMRALRR